MTDRATWREHLDQRHAAIDEYRQAEQRAFEPAESAEALILRVIGGWEVLLARVNFTRFHAAGYGASPLEKQELAKAMREVADSARIRWPHQQWSATAAKAKLARNELAHMLYVFSVTGDMPDRTINVLRLGEAGAPRKTPDGNPGELSWREKAWSMQARHIAPISEQVLVEALQGMKWMIDCCRGLLRLRDILAEADADLPDDKVIDPFLWQVNWWLPEWGDPKTTPLTVAHVRMQPGESN